MILTMSSWTLTHLNTVKVLVLNLVDLRKRGGGYWLNKCEMDGHSRLALEQGDRDSKVQRRMAGLRKIGHRMGRGAAGRAGTATEEGKRWCTVGWGWWLVMERRC
jgi:hypothetical protein